METQKNGQSKLAQQPGLFKSINYSPLEAQASLLSFDYWNIQHGFFKTVIATAIAMLNLCKEDFQINVIWSKLKITINCTLFSV